MPSRLTARAARTAHPAARAVTQLSVFVASNQGDEETTKVTKIALAGWVSAGGGGGGRGWRSFSI